MDTLNNILGFIVHTFNFADFMLFDYCERVFLINIILVYITFIHKNNPISKSIYRYTEVLSSHKTKSWASDVKKMTICKYGPAKYESKVIDENMRNIAKEYHARYTLLFFVWIMLISFVAPILFFVLLYIISILGKITMLTVVSFGAIITFYTVKQSKEHKQKD